MNSNSHEIPNGSAAAALAAAGVGCTALGILTVLVETNFNGAKSWLNLYNPVGPLSGVSCGAVIVYLLTWLILSMMLRGRSVRLGRWIAVAFLLLIAGLALTFPPVFNLFVSHG